MKNQVKFKYRRFGNQASNCPKIKLQTVPST